jgi:hypothetical protein
LIGRKLPVSFAFTASTPLLLRIDNGLSNSCVGLPVSRYRLSKSCQNLDDKRSLCLLMASNRMRGAVSCTAGYRRGFSKRPWVAMVNDSFKKMASNAPQNSAGFDCPRGCKN